MNSTLKLSPQLSLFHSSHDNDVRAILVWNSIARQAEHFPSIFGKHCLQINTNEVVRPVLDVVLQSSNQQHSYYMEVNFVTT